MCLALALGLFIFIAGIEHAKYFEVRLAHVCSNLEHTYTSVYTRFYIGRGEIHSSIACTLNNCSNASDLTFCIDVMSNVVNSNGLQTQTREVNENERLV